MLTPQTSTIPANAVYCPLIQIGMSIVDGAPVGVISAIQFAQAVVDMETGAWSDNGITGVVNGITFGFDMQGNVVGLPEEFAALGPQMAAAWVAIDEIAGAINQIRKVV